MKLAILISGHLRTSEYTYQSLQRNVLNKYDCDVFISTWDNIGNTLYHAHYKNGYDEKDDKINIDKIKEMYKPKSIIIEDGLSEEIYKIKKPFEGIKTRNGADVYQIIPMFYKMWNCNNLKKEYEKNNNFKYDYVLRCRFDSHINHLNFNNDIKEIQFIQGHCGFNDIIFIGPNQHMNDVFDLYTILTPQINYGNFENAENILYEHVINNEIPYKLSDIINYYFIKLTGVYDFKGNKICELDKLKL